MHVHQSYCQKRQFVDGLLVTESKLLLWLQEDIVASGNLHKAKRRKINEDGQEASTSASGQAPLSSKTIDGYVSAAINLYSEQVSLRTNNGKHPRGDALSSYLSSLKREDRKRKRDNYEDRAAGTIQDGYSREIYQRINQHLLEKPDVPHAARTRLDHLFGFAIMARGESMRQAQLADLFALPLPGEGAQEATAVVLIMDNGKTNAFGRIDYGGCMRAKNVVECPHGALAIHLFERFHVAKEPFPVLKTREDWYPIHLLNHTDRTKPLQYWTQYTVMRNIQGDLGIHTTKKTHLNRGGAARFAEDSGASEAEIRRAGRWNVQQMQGCYLTGLPRKAMRALAGFPTKPGGYHLPRATISPPPSLLTQIWPSIDLDLPKIEQGLDDFEKDLAAQGFCRLLQYLRTVLLQDAAILRKLHPDLLVLQHSLFASPIFLAYAAELEAAVEKNERPLSVSVHEVMPEVHRYLLDMQRDQQAAGLVNQSTNNVVLQLAGLVQGAFRSIMQEVEAVAEREVKVTVHVEQHQGSRLRPIATTTTAQTTAPQAGRLPPPPPLPLPPSPPLALPPPPLLLSPPTASPSPPPSPPTAPPPTSRQGRPSTGEQRQRQMLAPLAVAAAWMDPTLRSDIEMFLFFPSPLFISI